MKRVISSLKKKNTTVHAKTALIPFFIITFCLLGFMGYAATHAEELFKEPTALPPGGQPSGTNGVVSNLYSVLAAGANASSFLNPTIFGGKLIVPTLCFGTSSSSTDCKSDWASIIGGSLLTHVRNTQSAVYDISSTTYTDVPNSNVQITPTQSHRFLMTFTGETWVPANCSVWLRFTVDGVAKGGWPEGTQGTQITTITYLTDVLTSNTAHTFKVQAAQMNTTGNNCSANGAVGFNSNGNMNVVEMPDSSTAVTGGGLSSQNLQQVTDVGMTTTNGVTLDTDGNDTTRVGGMTMFGTATPLLSALQNLIYGNVNASSLGNLLLLQKGGIDKFKIDSNGNVGVGGVTPSVPLDIAGKIKIVDGTQGAGKVLTSDGAGLASWQTSGGGTSPILFTLATYPSTENTTAKKDAACVNDFGTAYHAATALDVSMYATTQTFGQFSTRATGGDSLCNVALGTNGSLNMACEYTGNQSGSWRVACVRNDNPILFTLATYPSTENTTAKKDAACVNDFGTAYHAATALDVSMYATTQTFGQFSTRATGGDSLCNVALGTNGSLNMACEYTGNQSGSWRVACVR